MFGGEAAGAPLIRQGVASGDTLAGIEGRKIVGIQKVGIVGRHQGKAQLQSEGDAGLVQGILLYLAIALYLQIKTVWKQINVTLCQLPCTLRIAQYRLSDFPLPCCRKGNQSATVFLLQPGTLNARLAILQALQKGAREKMAQGAKSAVIPTEQDQACTRIRGAFALQPKFGPDDGFDAHRPGGIIKFDEGEEIAVIGDGHCRHLQLRTALHQLFDGNDSILEGILGVYMQMDKTGCHIPCSSMRATGAKPRRCRGVTPKRCRDCRCRAVP